MRVLSKRQIDAPGWRGSGIIIGKQNEQTLVDGPAYEQTGGNDRTVIWWSSGGHLAITRGRQLTQTKIGQLDRHLLVDQQVLWLEIAVND